MGREGPAQDRHVARQMLIPNRQPSRGPTVLQASINQQINTAKENTKHRLGSSELTISKVCFPALQNSTARSSLVSRRRAPVMHNVFNMACAVAPVGCLLRFWVQGPKPEVQRWLRPYLRVGTAVAPKAGTVRDVSQGLLSRKIDTQLPLGSVGCPARGLAGHPDACWNRTKAENGIENRLHPSVSQPWSLRLW